MEIVAKQGTRLLVRTGVDEYGTAYGFIADEALTPLGPEKALITHLARGYWEPVIPDPQIVKRLAPYLDTKTRRVRDSAYWGVPVGTPLPLPQNLRGSIGDPVHLTPSVNTVTPTPREILDTPIPGVHVSISGEDPGVSGWIHIGDEAAAKDRLEQIESAVEMIGAMGYSKAKVKDLVDHHILHGKPLNPKFFNVEIVVRPMNTPNTLVSDEFANLLTGERRKWVKADEARERGWDGNPLDVSESLDGDYVEVEMTHEEWVERVEWFVQHEVETARAWETYKTEVAQRQRRIWEQVRANDYRVDPLYYLNTGEDTDEPSLVAASGDAQWSVR